MNVNQHCNTRGPSARCCLSAIRRSSWLASHAADPRALYERRLWHAGHVPRNAQGLARDAVQAALDENVSFESYDVFGEKIKPFFAWGAKTSQEPLHRGGTDASEDHRMGVQSIRSMSALTKDRRQDFRVRRRRDRDGVVRTSGPSQFSCKGVEIRPPEKGSAALSP